MIYTITLEDGTIIKTHDYSIFKEVTNGTELNIKLNSDDYFTVIDINGIKVTKKWSLIKEISIK